MTTKNEFPKASESIETTPFETVEDAWFWFVQAQQARNDGARFLAGQGMIRRPCEPVDFLKILDRLYRQRRLLRDHLLVLRHYGRRQLAPDQSRAKEVRAHFLWEQAFERIEPFLIRKGILRDSQKKHDHWIKAQNEEVERVRL